MACTAATVTGGWEGLIRRCSSICSCNNKAAAAEGEVRAKAFSSDDAIIWRSCIKGIYK